MHKIPTLYLRDPKTWLVTPCVHYDCGWVIKGEGIATRKYDGACCKISRDGFQKRREIKPGKPEPANFALVEEDEATGKRVGWVPVDPNDPADQYFIEAVEGQAWDVGTYELCGPKVQGNPEGLDKHTLIPHAAAEILIDAPREFAALREYLSQQDIEGIVFHHPDGRRAKIKKKDFRLKRKL